MPSISQAAASLPRSVQALVSRLLSSRGPQLDPKDSLQAVRYVWTVESSLGNRVRDWEAMLPTQSLSQPYDYSNLGTEAAQAASHLQASICQHVARQPVNKFGPLTRAMLATFLRRLPSPLFPPLSDESRELLAFLPTAQFPFSLEDAHNAYDTIHRFLHFEVQCNNWWGRDLEDQLAVYHPDVIEATREAIHFDIACWRICQRPIGPAEKAMVSAWLLGVVPPLLFPPLDEELRKFLRISRKERAVRLNVSKVQPKTYPRSQIVAFA